MYILLDNYDIYELSSNDYILNKVILLFHVVDSSNKFLNNIHHY
jgi:hypothetical protein